MSSSLWNVVFKKNNLNILKKDTPVCNFVCNFMLTRITTSIEAKLYNQKEGQTTNNSCRVPELNKKNFNRTNLRQNDSVRKRGIIRVDGKSIWKSYISTFVYWYCNFLKRILYIKHNWIRNHLTDHLSWVKSVFFGLPS